MKKIVYLFDATGQYCGTYAPQESPLERGVFIVPINSTELPPPEVGIYHKAIFDGTEWLTVDIEQPASLTVDQIKARQWEAIKAERDRRKAGGVKVGAKWFHSDDGSRIQQMGLVMMGASIPANLQWKTMDGSFITMTQALASQVFQAVAASDQAVFVVAEQHKATMEASADPASYDYSGGWPKIYGE